MQKPKSPHRTERRNLYATKCERPTRTDDRLHQFCSIISRSSQLLPQVFNPALADFFARYYRKKGVQLYLSAEPDHFALDHEPQGVIMKGQSDLVPAQMVVVGIGATPNIDLFRDSDLELDDGILVNAYLETNLEGIYAAGDIARYPDSLYHTRRRVEHWQNAVDQGRHAARAMLGQRTAFKSVPYFFSDMFDLSWEFWGDPQHADAHITHERFDDASAAVWWVRDQRLIAAFLLNRSEAERDIAQQFTGQDLLFSENMLEGANPQAFRDVNA